MKRRFILLLLPVVLLFSSCHKNPLDIDVSKIKVNLQFIRFDTIFCSIKPDSIYKYIPDWTLKYPNFWPIYSEQLLGLGRPEQYVFLQRTKNFFEYCHQFHVFSDVEKHFPPSDSSLKYSLVQAFKHYKYYFPKAKIPRIFATITGFQVSVYTGNNFVGIGLERYLGSNYPLYVNLGYELYQRRRMIPQMIPIDVMRAWAVAEFPYNDSADNLLNRMIYEGRLQYFLDAMFPNAPDTLKWAYTKMQWKWANMYEKKIWNYLVENNLLFTQKHLTIKIFTGPAAFTTPFHRNSAPRAGTFIGYKIVKAYIKHHPNVTLSQLMHMRDYLEIYNGSYYEP